MSSNIRTRHSYMKEQKSYLATPARAFAPASAGGGWLSNVVEGHNGCPIDALDELSGGIGRAAAPGDHDDSLWT